MFTLLSGVLALLRPCYTPFAYASGTSAQFSLISLLAVVDTTVAQRMESNPSGFRVDK